MINAFFDSIIVVLISIIVLYKWIIIIGAILTWFSPNPNNPIVNIIYQLTNPAYNFIRKYIPTSFGSIDLAPIILIFALIFLETFLIRAFNI